MRMDTGPKRKSDGYALTVANAMRAEIARRRKPKQLKWWQLPSVTLAVLQAIPGHNKKINKARIANLQKRVLRKERLASDHKLAGRLGKANKMASRAEANEREIRSIERRM